MSETTTTTPTTTDSQTESTPTVPESQVSAPTPAPTAESQPSTPTPAPTAESQTQPVVDDLRAQLDALHGELQLWKLKSSMNERHIIPQDFDLVSRLVLELASSSGKSIDQCVSDLYASKSYLFKVPKSETKSVANQSKEVDNKRLIEGAIARLSRAKITL